MKFLMYVKTNKPAIALILLSLANLSWAQSHAVTAASCNALTNIKPPHTKLLSAGVVAANAFTAPGSERNMQLPSFCRVIGVSNTAVNFEVWLPLSDWNGKYQGVGNGGMAGTISYLGMARAVRSGYATASTDTGHVAGPIPFDASWASGRPDLIEDFGHRALHLTTLNAKQITEAFYASPPNYSYYVGCSKGGQQGLMEAQRYPDDFDGILAGNPANDWTRFYAGAHLWYSLAMLEDEESWIPPAKMKTLGNAVNAACDGLDGIEDGVLQNPLACTFKPATLLCAANTDNNACLSAKQVLAVEKIWSGVTNASGDLVFPPLVPGGEGEADGWSRWVTGKKPFGSLHWLGGEGFFRWFVFDDADWDFRTFDFDKDLAFALDKVGSAVDSDNPDLRPLRNAGAKLIVYHGWSDPDISPLGSINYFNDVVNVIANDSQDASKDSALSSTQDFFRLFMVPGMGHCRGGPGPDQFDALAALENWVENDIAPEAIIASKIVQGKTVTSRPLCVYPKVATYRGSGSTNSAKNFSCASPQ